MTRGCILTRKWTATERRDFHQQLQKKLGHYIPEKPRTYRAARRNAARAVR